MYANRVFCLFLFRFLLNLIKIALFHKNSKNVTVAQTHLTLRKTTEFFFYCIIIFSSGFHARNFNVFISDYRKNTCDFPKVQTDSTHRQMKGRGLTIFADSANCKSEATLAGWGTPSSAQ